MFKSVFRLRLFLTLAVGAGSFVALPKPLKAMSHNTAEQRHHAPYAALKPPADGDAEKVRRDPTSLAGPSTSPVAETDYLAAEADRLENLKQALFQAFVAAPKSGIPTALVDLAATYTSALRLQMTLKGYASVPKGSFKSPMFAAGKIK